jgi:hypothetical protein
MATNANVIAKAAGAVNNETAFNTFEVRSVAKLTQPAIGNYGPKYLLTFTRTDGTTFNVEYATSGARNTAFTNYMSAFATSFT